MATIQLDNLNARISQSGALWDAIYSPDFEKRLKDLEIDWELKTINPRSELFSLFVDQKFVEKSTHKLTKTGLLFFSRATIDFESEIELHSIVGDKYRILSHLKSGKNSVIYIAEHTILGYRVVLKFIRPGAADNITQALRLISGNFISENLVLPQDYFRFSIHDVFGHAVLIECVVYQFINGVSLKDFLNDERRPLNAHAVASFIKQVGGVLYELERLGAYHGDLHQENIVVDYNGNGSQSLAFYVIDVSFGITGSLESADCKDTDMAHFRQHIWNFLSAQQRYLSKMSIRKYLGAEIFTVVTQIMSSETKSFRQIQNLLNENTVYEKYLSAKTSFVQEKFAHPGSFKLQRYEEITDPKVAVKLFVPFPELMDNIISFSNIVITGNRGSGKSTYLAAVAFFPQIDSPIVDYRDVFGVYFPCRQGEFRLLASDVIDYDVVGLRRVKHVMVVKIIRRTLECISDGIKYNKITHPTDYSQLRNFLSSFIDNDTQIISLSSDVVSEMTNLVSILVRIEMKELDNIFNAKTKPSNSRNCTEIELLDFFNIIRATFSELASTRFHLLFDDAGTPNIPAKVQFIINDLIISSNPIYCVKLSTELYSYNYQSTEGKQLEGGHDYYMYDMSRLFFIGAATFGMDHVVLENYFKEIVAKRLDYFQYKSNDIVHYLEKGFTDSNQLVYRLATGRRDAYYCGWSIVWKIADRNPRNLLELISEIFSIGNINTETPPKLVKMRDQDRAIRSVSEKRLRSLAQISGTIVLDDGIINSLGQQLFDITTVIGSVFRIYLQSEPDKGRKDQFLALERNESSPLNPVANKLLQEMLRYGILDPSRLDYARDDGLKKPIYVLNRIYCPAFGIGIRRDQHLRLSKLKFEELLINPKTFVSQGTERLRNYGKQDADRKQKDLFDSLYDE